MDVVPRDSEEGHGAQQAGQREGGAAMDAAEGEGKEEGKDDDTSSAGEQHKERNIVRLLRRVVNIRSCKYDTKLDTLIINVGACRAGAGNVHGSIWTSSSLTVMHVTFILHPRQKALEMRPFAAPHNEKQQAWKAAAKAAREAAKKHPNPYIRSKAEFIKKTNMWKRLKKLRQIHRDKEWSSLRSSGSQEEINAREEAMRALDEEWTAAEEDIAQNKTRKVSEVKARLENARTLQGSLFARAVKTGVLAQRGKEHAAEQGVPNHTKAKVASTKPTIVELCSLRDEMTEQQRRTNDVLGKLEASVDDLVQEGARALAAEEAQRKKQEEEGAKALAAQEAQRNKLEEEMTEVRGSLAYLVKGMQQLMAGVPGAAAAITTEQTEEH